MRRTCVALLVLVPSLASAGGALDKPAFTATPAELLAEAKKAPAGDTGAVVLRHDEEISFDDKGLGMHRIRLVILITSQDGADNWNGVWREWRPWQQNAPVLRARVVSPSGQVTDVDTSKLVDEPNEVGALRHVGVQLPPLAPGSVIEEQSTTTDSAPFLGGRAFALPLSEDDPTTSLRVDVSAPASLKVRLVERALPRGLKPRHATAMGRETWSYTAEHIPVASVEWSVPEDTMTIPTVWVTAVPSWADAAHAYAAAVAKGLAITQPAELPHGDSIEVAAAVKGWLHHHVRYVGGELLDTPYDTLQLDSAIKRGTAGANEITALLVALLRGAGISADIVLVDRGPGYGADRDSPWLGAFDHALVRAHIKGQDVWLDPEKSELPVGQLRAEDQGRRALSIADGALIHTPAAPPRDNAIREVRTLEIAELGLGRITEVSHEGGLFEPDQRSWIGDTAPAEVRKSLGSYAKKEYGGELTSYTTTAPDDLTKAFDMTVTADHSDHVNTHWTNADVWLYPGDALARIDDALRRADGPARTADLVVMRPHVYEIENRIVIPEGFTIPAAEPDHTFPVGVYRIVERQRVDKRTLVVAFQLAADKQRLTPAEVTETARAIKAMLDESVHLVIPHTGWSLVDHGDLKKGLAELDRLVTLRPREPLYHARLAQALLHAGDGDGARREARKAVEVDPKNVDALVALGFVLEHDLIGRRWAKGFDRAGARAALVKAHALNPKHYGAALDLATLLERDDRGRRFEAGSEPRAAADAWRAVVDLDPSDAHRISLARALLWAGDAAAAEAVLRKVPASTDRTTLLAATVAITQGSDAAQRIADTGDRDAILRTATGTLVLMRQYDAARKLAAAGGASAPPSFYEHLRRDDAPYRPAPDPKDVALELVLEELDPDNPIAVAWDKQVAADMRDEASKTVPPLVESITHGAFADIMRAGATFTVDGDAAAWRVEMTGFDGRKGIVYLASDGKGPKVIGTPPTLRGVGYHVLRLAGKNDDAAARLLSWIEKDAHKPELAAIWGANLPRDTGAIRLAGALLAYDPARNVEIASKCLVTTTQAQFLCDTMVVDGYMKLKRWSELETFVTGTWTPRAPKGIPGVQEIRGEALMHLGRFDDAKQVFSDELAKFPDDRAAMYWLGMLALHDGHRNDALQRFTALAQRSDATPTDLNNIAWLKVSASLDIPDAVAIAKKATQPDSKKAFLLNTLAAVEAESDALGDAIKDVTKSVELEPDKAPSPADWYVIARVLDKAGLRDDAIAAYRRIPKQDPELFGFDLYTLATNRLKALGAKR